MTTNFTKSTWHFKHYVSRKPLGYNIDPVVIPVHDYVETVLGSVLNTYVFNQNAPFMALFTLCSSDKLFALPATAYYILASIIAIVLAGTSIIERKHFKRVFGKNGKRGTFKGLFVSYLLGRHTELHVMPAGGKVIVEKGGQS